LYGRTRAFGLDDGIPLGGRTSSDVGVGVPLSLLIELEHLRPTTVAQLGGAGEGGTMNCRDTIVLLERKIRCRLALHHETEGRRKLHVASIRLKLPKQHVEIVVIRWRRVP
jgi:hypothetical protein